MISKKEIGMNINGPYGDIRVGSEAGGRACSCVGVAVGLGVDRGDKEEDKYA